jgi:DNA-binding IclR family transcriptional regulator
MHRSQYEAVLDALQADRLTAAELSQLTGLPSLQLGIVLDAMLTGGLLMWLPDDRYCRRVAR